MDAALDELRIARAELPPGGFTRLMFQERYKIGEGAAHNKLQALIRAGKIQKAGKSGAYVYYRFT